MMIWPSPLDQPFEFILNFFDLPLIGQSILQRKLISLVCCEAHLDKNAVSYSLISRNGKNGPCSDLFYYFPDFAFGTFLSETQFLSSWECHEKDCLMDLDTQVDDPLLEYLFFHQLDFQGSAKLPLALLPYSACFLAAEFGSHFGLNSLLLPDWNNFTCSLCYSYTGSPSPSFAEYQLTFPELNLSSCFEPRDFRLNPKTTFLTTYVYLRDTYFALYRSVLLKFFLPELHLSFVDLLKGLLFPDCLLDVFFTFKLDIITDGSPARRNR